MIMFESLHVVLQVTRSSLKYVQLSFPWIWVMKSGIWSDTCQDIFPGIFYVGYFSAYLVGRVSFRHTLLTLLFQQTNDNAKDDRKAQYCILKVFSPYSNNHSYSHTRMQTHTVNTHTQYTHYINATFTHTCTILASHTTNTCAHIHYLHTTHTALHTNNIHTTLK